jgi:hypothetical protein
LCTLTTTMFRSKYTKFNDHNCSENVQRRVDDPSSQAANGKRTEQISKKVRVTVSKGNSLRFA